MLCLGCLCSGIPTHRLRQCVLGGGRAGGSRAPCAGLAGGAPTLPHRFTGLAQPLSCPSQLCRSLPPPSNPSLCLLEHVGWSVKGWKGWGWSHHRARTQDGARPTPTPIYLSSQPLSCPPKHCRSLPPPSNPSLCLLEHVEWSVKGWKGWGWSHHRARTQGGARPTPTPIYLSSQPLSCPSKLCRSLPPPSNPSLCLLEHVGWSVKGCKGWGWSHHRARTQDGARPTPTPIYLSSQPLSCPSQLCRSLPPPSNPSLCLLEHVGWSVKGWKGWGWSHHRARTQDGARPTPTPIYLSSQPLSCPPKHCRSLPPPSNPSLCLLEHVEWSVKGWKGWGWSHHRARTQGGARPTPTPIYLSSQPLSCPSKLCRSLPPPSNPSLCLLEHVGWSVKGCKGWGWSHHRARTQDGARPTPTPIYLSSQPLSCPSQLCRSLPPPSNPSLCLLEHVGWSVKGCKGWGWSHHRARTQDGARPTPTPIYLSSQPLSCPSQLCRSLPPPSNPSLCLLEHVGWSVKGWKGWGWSHHRARTQDGARPTPTPIYLSSQPLSCPSKLCRSLPPPSNPSLCLLEHVGWSVKGWKGWGWSHHRARTQGGARPTPTPIYLSSQPLSCPSKLCRSLPPPSNPSLCLLEHVGWSVKGWKGWGWSHHRARTQDGARPTPTPIYLSSQPLSCPSQLCRSLPPPSNPSLCLLEHVGWSVKGCKGWGWSHHRARTQDGARPTPTPIYLSSQPLSCPSQLCRSLPPPSNPSLCLLEHVGWSVKGCKGWGWSHHRARTQDGARPTPTPIYLSSQPLSCPSKLCRSLPPPLKPLPVLAGACWMVGEGL